MRQILDSQLTNPSDDTFQCFFSSASLRFGTLYVTAQYGTSWHIAQRKIYSSSN